MNRHVTLKQLRCFLAVAETGSFTQAAERVFLTQSSLTIAIRQLEESLGIKLFDRTTRKVSLTASARQFHTQAEKLLRGFDTLIDDTRALVAGYSGHIRIAASPSIMAVALIPTLARFRERSPGVTVSIRDAGSADIERRVYDGELDFGICSRLQDHSELKYLPLIRDHYGVVCSHDHPFSRLDRPIGWRDVKKHRESWVGLISDTLVGRVHKKILGEGAADNYPEEISSTYMLGSMLALGNRFSIIPSLARVAHQLNDFCFLELEKPYIERELCLVTRRLRSMSPAACLLLETMYETISELELPIGAELISRNVEPVT